ncbi:hypothetical protein JCM8097_006143 [Rhodosporidiobolus ruineniae]
MFNQRSGLDSLLVLRAELNSVIDRVASNALDPLPALDDLYSPVTNPSADVLEATRLAREIVALLQGTRGTIEKSYIYHVPACMCVVIEAHVAETLREASVAGKPALHVEEIAKSSCINPSKLARVLRLLAAHHIFVETEPDVFALNRPAMPLDTGKSVKELVESKPAEWFNGTDGVAALISNATENMAKAATTLADVLLSPSLTNLTSPEDGPFAQHFGEPAWEYFNREGNERHLNRFAAAMRSLQITDQGGKDRKGFPFHDLPDGATVVDVGSGVGGASLALAKSLPKVNFVLQDQKEVIEGAAKQVWRQSRPSEVYLADGSVSQLWEKEVPEALESGRVKLMPHDFFGPQPVKGADVYFLRAIIHDWDDANSIKILSQLADAASSTSKLVLIERPYSYLSPSSSGSSAALDPLFPLVDLQMLVACNGQERTKEQHEALAAKAGWRMGKVWTTGAAERQEGLFREYEFVKV